MSNPDLDPDDKSRLVKQLMDARRAVKATKAAHSPEAEAAAHRLVDRAKRGLGERGTSVVEGWRAGLKPVRR